MKKLNLFGAALLIAASSMIYSCKKDKKEDPMSTDDTETIKTNAEDESDVQSSSDEISDDVDVAMDENASVGGRMASGPCGGTVTVDSANKKITITYNGTPCLLSGKTKTGTVTAQLINGLKWKDQGAQINITIDVVVTKGLKSITIAGNKTITNVTGGLLKDLASVSYMIHRIKGSLSVTFPNSSVRTWNVARKITYSSTSGVKSIQIEGDTILPGVTGNVVIWGTTRNGEDFKNVILEPIKANGLCGWNRPTAGVRSHTGKRTFKATFGLDASGNVVASGCADFFKVEWTNLAGENKSAILPY